MAIQYRIYSNHGGGGPVDYTAPLAATPGLSYVAGPLGVSTDTTFVVRAFDPSTGFEEANTGPGVRLLIGPDGADLSGLSNPPRDLRLTPVAGGGCRVGWSSPGSTTGGAPSGFFIYLAQGAVTNYAAPAAQVGYTPGVVAYSCALAGPYAPSAYTAAVRAFNATGVESNTASVTGDLGTPWPPYQMEPLGVVSNP